jgi:hypothetical protein
MRERSSRKTEAIGWIGGSFALSASRDRGTADLSCGLPGKKYQKGVVSAG